MKSHTKEFPSTQHTVFFFLFLFTFHSSSAQSSLTVLENRLSKTWKLDRSMETEKYTAPNQVLGDFVMILNPDHTVEQGMSPDGLIGGKWSVDEKTMILTIKDDVTNQEYKMKITSFTPDELVLQDPSGNNPALIHYRAK